MTNLRELAEAAKAAHEGGDLGAFSDAFGEFQRAATPAAISALYAELDEAREDSEWMRENRNKWQDATTEARRRAEAAEASLSEKEREVERLQTVAYRDALVKVIRAELVQEKRLRLSCERKLAALAQEPTNAEPSRVTTDICVLAPDGVATAIRARGET